MKAWPSVAVVRRAWRRCRDMKARESAGAGASSPSKKDTPLASSKYNTVEYDWARPNDSVGPIAWDGELSNDR